LTSEVTALQKISSGTSRDRTSASGALNTGKQECCDIGGPHSHSNFVFLQDFGTIRRMALDPLHPPIWLRKLHVSAQQISPEDYAQTPEEGLLRGCELSDAVLQFSVACARALGSGPLPPRLPFENPFRPNQILERFSTDQRGDLADG